MGFDWASDRGTFKAVNVGEPDGKAKKKRDPTKHIRLLPPGVLFCRRCGDHYEWARPIAVTLLAALAKQYGKDHKKCKADKTKGLCCPFCFEFGHESPQCPRLDYGGNPMKWLQGPDTGISSRALWTHMMGRDPSKTEDGARAPRDPEDFGRSYRLLKAFPEWRGRIKEMSRYPEWTDLVYHWYELEQLYEEALETGKSTNLYLRMCQYRGVEP